MIKLFTFLRIVSTLFYVVLVFFSVATGWDHVILGFLGLKSSVEGCFVFSTLLQNVIECKMVFRIVWNVLGLLQKVVDCCRSVSIVFGCLYI